MYPKFVESGVVTPDGLHLIEWIEAQYTSYDKPGADANIAALNGLAGPVVEYYVHVNKLKLTPAKWMESFPNSARNAYDIMKYVEEQAQKEAEQAAMVTATADKASVLESELAKLKEALEATIAKLEESNAALLAENAALKTQPVETPKRKGKGKSEPVIEAVEETETEPVEDSAVEEE